MHAVTILYLVVSVTSLPVFNSENNTTDLASSTITSINDVTKIQSFNSGSAKCTQDTKDKDYETTSKECHRERGDIPLHDFDMNEDIFSEQKENLTELCQETTSENSTKVPQCIKDKSDKEIQSINNTTDLIESSIIVGVETVTSTTAMPLIFSENEKLTTPTNSDNQKLENEITNTTLPVIDVQQNEVKPEGEIKISPNVSASNTEGKSLRKDKNEKILLSASNSTQEQLILHEEIIASPLNKSDSKYMEQIPNKDEIIRINLLSSDSERIDTPKANTTSSPLGVSAIAQTQKSNKKKKEQQVREKKGRIFLPLTSSLGLHTPQELKKPLISKPKINSNAQQKKNSSNKKQKKIIFGKKMTSLPSVSVNQEKKHKLEQQKKEDIISSSRLGNQQQLTKQSEPITSAPLRVHFDDRLNWQKPEMGGISSLPAATDIMPELDEVSPCGEGTPNPWFTFPEPQYFSDLISPPFRIEFPPISNFWPFRNEIIRNPPLIEYPDFVIE